MLAFEFPDKASAIFSKNNTFLVANKSTSLLDDVVLVSDTDNSKPVITVGYQNNSALMYNDKSYNAKGYGYDVLKKLSQSAGVEFKFVEIEGSLLEAVQNGLVDISGLYAKTPERSRQVAFSSVPVTNYQFALSVQGAGERYYYNDIEAINGKMVATYRDNPANILLDIYLKENNISVNYVYGEFPDYIDLEAHYYLTPSSLATQKNFSSVLNSSIENAYFVARKDNERILDFLDLELYKLFVEYGSLHYDLFRKYQPNSNQYRNRDLNVREAALLRGKTFKVGYIDNHLPYQAKNSNGEPEGINVDFMNLLAKRYEFEVEYIPYNLDDHWATSEDFDIIISLVGDRNHLARYYDNTDSYHSMDTTLILQENLMQNFDPDLWDYNLPKNAKVGVLNYLAFKYTDFFRRDPTAKLIRFSDTHEMLDSFVNNELDAVIVTEFGGNTVASSIQSGRQQASLGLSLGMELMISKKISEDYLSIFNTILNKVPQDSINDIIVNELAKYTSIFGVRQFINEYMYVAIAVVLGFLGTIIGLFIAIRQRLAIHSLEKDELTMLPSLSKFTVSVDSILAKANPGEYIMIVLDVDYFRMINNYYGTSKGTEVIQVMSSALIDAYKGSNVLLTRQVAERFIIFKKRKEGRKIQEVINAFVIPRIKTILGENYSLKMSVGYCANLEKSEKMNNLLDNANTAHQKAKQLHYTSFQEFTEEMRAKSNIMLDIIYRMEHALKNKEFQVHYQPKIDFSNLKICGAEALVRWIPPIGNPIYPGDFIPVMQKNGFISKLEVYVFEEVCNFLHKNPSVKTQKMAVNISPITLSNPATLKQLVEILKEYKISPNRIEIEISETAIGDFEESLPMVIKILHKIGFTVAMDDFGTGNASLNRLSAVEVDVLKLDKVFLDFNENKARGSLVVQHLIHLAKKFGMKIVAEGTENKNQAKWLKNVQCDMAQGFYFAKVLNENDLMQLIREDKQYSLE